MADSTIPVTGVTVMERSRSGRVTKIKISSEAGDTVLYKDRIRFSLSLQPLPSTWFQVECLRGGSSNVASVEFTGKGYGHGVGMCQWGAIGMAREGKNYKRILKKFYENVRIVRLY
jgi:stage II sporulation protein D